MSDKIKNAFKLGIAACLGLSKNYSECPVLSVDFCANRDYNFGRMEENMKTLMTKKEVAEYFGYRSTRSIDRLVRKNRLTPLYPGGDGHPRFDRGDVENFFRQKSKS